MELKENHRLKGGRYVVVRVLGQGGFGITYLALDSVGGTQVAIKEFFPRDYCGRYPDGRLSMGNSRTAQIVETLRQRFYKEARNLSHLNHPNIVKIREVFDENDTTYIVMDYIQGETLQTKVRRLGALSEAKAVEYIRAVGAALAYIHNQHVTHFDVKPANVIVRGVDDRPILIDFGFSKEYTPESTNNPTKTPPAVSPGYSAMELYNTATFEPFSPQSDVYSLGATLFYLVMGQTPPTPGELFDHGFRLPDTLSAEMRQAIGTAMKLKRSERTDKVTDILNLLPEPEPEPEPDNDEHTHLINTGDSNSDRFVHRRLSELEKKNKELRQRCEYAEAMVKEYEDNSDEPSGAKKNMPWILFFISGLLCIVAMTRCSIYESDYQNAYYRSEQYRQQVNDQHTQNVNLNSKIQDLQSQVQDLQSQIQNSRQRNRALESTINKMSTSQPLIIDEVQVANANEPWGAKIYSQNTTYLYFRIKVSNLAHRSQTIGVKFYTPTGMSTGTKSKHGFSYTWNISSSDGWQDMSGWGGTDKGHWRPGNYRVEFWLDGKCLASKSFHVY